jgi:hypothetical protein
LKIEIVARSGCGDCVYPIILEEKLLVSLEENNPEKVAEKIGGKVVEIEGKNVY